MRLVFAMSGHHPHAGLRGYCTKIAEEALRRGHSVTICCSSWTGSAPDGAELRNIPERGLTGASRLSNFFTDFKKELLKLPCDLSVGFDAGAGLDVYFLFESHPIESGSWFRTNAFSGTQNALSELKEKVFSPKSKTQIFYVLEQQKQQYMGQYGTPVDRFFRIPPIGNAEEISAADHEERRRKMRFALSLGKRDYLLICRSSNLKSKGADRVIRAIAALHPTVRNWVRCCMIGPKQSELERLAESLKVEKSIRFEGVRKNAVEYLIAADLMLMPAHGVSTGSGIMEALSLSTPVICTDCCGFHSFVQESGAGWVMDSPFDQNEFNAVLESVLFEPSRLASLRAEAAAYSEQFKNNQSAVKAVDVLEKLYAKKQS